MGPLLITLAIGILLAAATIYAGAPVLAEGWGVHPITAAKTALSLGVGILGISALAAAFSLAGSLGLTSAMAIAALSAAVVIAVWIRG